MTDSNDKAKGEGDVPEPDAVPEESAAEATPEGVEAVEGMFAAEGPDVETSLDDADLSFLDQSAGDLAAERLADLQRLQAEYANYRKRVDRDREVNRIADIAGIVSSLLPVLDDIDRAEAHGDLADGPFVIIAQKLRSSLERTGLTKVGAKDEPFDHHVHEAIVQLPSDDVTEMTVFDVHQTGYKLGERLLRPAQVAVAVPKED